ncbi:TonB-dependent receptor [Granulicella sp. 5B5]|uniref:TonB-dependent receptor n=1 Tax=Granulicella sp. 5B5 TaxID=1617967 RepID=UPI0015F77CDA|nr:TonB-dependent receptor [Granulicella sp. 5B5]QMV19743.1 TonB-dependent receptor [Granulicella sp. 5B5]
MYRSWISVCLFLPAILTAQQPCPTGVRVEGDVLDPSGAMVPAARIKAANRVSSVSDQMGRFVLQCIPAGSAIEVSATGFNTASATATGAVGEVVHVTVTLSLANIDSVIQVDADTAALDDTNGAGTISLNTKEIEQLPDDPDDLLAELQMMAASSGGDPSTVVITVNGFQNASAMPPKASIASIRINPDIFSSEYQAPQWHGGRIEITTKPGADIFHGALFFTDSNPAFNARDPFSLTSTPAGKHRYGVELTGPIRHNRADFAMALEKRDIDEFNVVNAITLDSNFNQVPLHDAVEALQHLWIGSLSANWQMTPKDTATLAFSSNVNSLGNQGIGGLTLSTAGYSNLISEYDLRFNNTQTLSANLLHETRVGYSWKRNEETPNSTEPSVQVAGYFTDGGSMGQDLNTRERDLEIDDSLMLTRGKHTLKVGAQSLGIFEHNYYPSNFNGTFVFGGGSAPVLDASNNPTGQTTTITAAEQYRRAQLSLPGGTPTTYQITTGNPLVSFTQWHLGLFAQDTIKVEPNLTLDAGLRYQLQTTPASFADFLARLGLSWSPDKKQRWVFHLRGGLFSGPTSLSIMTDVARLGSGRQQEMLIYSPRYTAPLTPVAGSTQINTIYNLFPHFRQDPAYQGSAVVEHDLPCHWHLEADYNLGGEWNNIREININAPEVASSTGVAPDPMTALSAPRPGPPNVNIYQYQDYGHARGWWIASTLTQHSSKWLNSQIVYWYVDFRANSMTPQSTYSSQGESARPDWMRRDGLSVNEVITLPRRIEFSSYFNWQPGTPYNITTGTDANGDGTFNDRPSFATVPGAGVYSTRYGLLTTNTVNGDVPYNLGRLPQIIQFSANLSKAFQLNRANKDSPRLLTFNVRAANVLNQTRVTAVGTVVSSPTHGQALTAEEARRVELGARFSF